LVGYSPSTWVAGFTTPVTPPKKKDQNIPIISEPDNHIDTIVHESESKPPVDQPEHQFEQKDEIEGSPTENVMEKNEEDISSAEQNPASNDISVSIHRIFLSSFVVLFLILSFVSYRRRRIEAQRNEHFQSLYQPLLI
jgi:hypothetical protein